MVWRSTRVGASDCASSYSSIDHPAQGSRAQTQGSTRCKLSSDGLARDFEGHGRRLDAFPGIILMRRRSLQQPGLCSVTAGRGVLEVSFKSKTIELQHSSIPTFPAFGLIDRPTTSNRQDINWIVFNMPYDPSLPPAWLASEMPKENLGDFDGVDWVEAIINDKDCREIAFGSRTIQRNRTLHSLFNRTLATNDTLRACQAFLRLRPAQGDERPDLEDGRKKESLLIASMGRGLDGHDGLAHGGTVATLFDEGLSLGALQVLPSSFMTANTVIKYKAPVPTPGLVLIRCWCEKVEGRKAWIKGTMEDGKGKVYAESESLYIISKQQQQTSSKM